MTHETPQPTDDQERPFELFISTLTNSEQVKLLISTSSPERAALLQTIKAQLKTYSPHEFGVFTQLLNMADPSEDAGFWTDERMRAVQALVGITSDNRQGNGPFFNSKRMNEDNFKSRSDRKFH